MMYFNSILNNKNTGNKNTIMETILKNIKDLRNEFCQVPEYCVDGYSYIQNETMGKVDNLEALQLQRRYQLLAESNNSKALSPTPDDNCSYYSSDMDNGRNPNYTRPENSGKGRMDDGPKEGCSNWKYTNRFYFLSRSSFMFEGKQMQGQTYPERKRIIRGPKDSKNGKR